MKNEPNLNNKNYCFVSEGKKRDLALAPPNDGESRKIGEFLRLVFAVKTRDLSTSEDSIGSGKLFRSSASNILKLRTYPASAFRCQRCLKADNGWTDERGGESRAEKK